MNVEIKFTEHQYEIAFKAMVTAWARSGVFTVSGLCAMWGLKDNRHTRAVIQRMVGYGLLVRHKRLFSDGHYRYLYAAQRTKPMFGGQTTQTIKEFERLSNVENRKTAIGA
jgi:predicted transcriptional regulator